MGVTIEIDAPHLMPHLIDRLAAVGCTAQLVGARACRVVHTQALDSAEALTELRFFVRAWAGRHGGVTFKLQPDA